jgi:hypothetical protein
MNSIIQRTITVTQSSTMSQKNKEHRIRTIKNTCYAVSTGKQLPAFRRIFVPPSLVSNIPKQKWKASFLEYLILIFQLSAIIYQLTRATSPKTWIFSIAVEGTLTVVNFFLIFILFIGRKTGEKRMLSILLVSLPRSMSYERSVASSTAISP